MKNLDIFHTILQSYTWWSNLPVYDCKIANQFLKWINFSNNNLSIFCWNIFDDMVYNFFVFYFTIMS